MNGSNKYFKKYELKSQYNKYELLFEQQIDNNEEKLLIQLTHFKTDRKLIFSTTKTLHEIKNVYSSLSHFDSIIPLINYLSSLTKLDRINIEKNVSLIYNLIFMEENNNTILFILKRDINDNNNAITREEIENLYLHQEQLQYQIKCQEEKIKKLTSKLKQELLQKQGERFSITSTHEKIEDKETTDNNVCIFVSGIMSTYEKIEDKEKKDNKVSVVISECMNDSNNKENENKDENISRPSMNNNVIESSSSFTIFKENNNQIVYGHKPVNSGKKKLISKEEECETFTAFQNLIPIVAWTYKKTSNVINIKNLNSNDDNIFSAEEIHKKKIDSLIYFHNDNLDKDNDYIISFSKEDINMLIIWKILNDINIELESFKILTKNDIQRRISCFCVFSNKNFSENNYFFLYEEKQNEEIFSNISSLQLIQFDNEFKKVKKTLSIENKETVQYLDTYYHQNQTQLYLINCNNNNVQIIIFQKDNDKNISKIEFKKPGITCHFCGFIVERNKSLELFESNIEGIYIWDINGKNENPKIKIEIKSTVSDMCILNDDYLCVSTLDGFQVIQISKSEISFSLKESEKKKGERRSKIRKIVTAQEHRSIIGLDKNKNLCLWPI